MTYFPHRIMVAGDSQGVGTQGEGGIREGLAHVLSRLGAQPEFVGSASISSSESRLGYQGYSPNSGVRGVAHNCWGGATSAQILNGTSPATTSLGDALATHKPNWVVIVLGSNDTSGTVLENTAKTIMETVRTKCPTAHIQFVGPGQSVSTSWAFVRADTARLAIHKNWLNGIAAAGVSCYSTSLMDLYQQMYAETRYGNTDDQIAISGFYDTAHFKRSVYTYAGCVLAAQRLGMTLPEVVAAMKGAGVFMDRPDPRSATGLGSGDTTIYTPSDFQARVSHVTFRNAHASLPATVKLQHEVVTQAGASLGTPIKKDIANVQIAPASSQTIPMPYAVVPMQSRLIVSVTGTTPNIDYAVHVVERWPGA